MIVDRPARTATDRRARIHDPVQHDSQFINPTHSPILTAYPMSTTYNLSPKGIAKIDNYQTELNQVTQNFLLNQQRTLDRLLDFQPARAIRKARKNRVKADDKRLAVGSVNLSTASTSN